MPTCKADPSITRHEVEGFKFPLGAYPVDSMSPKAGYSMHFEQSDGGGDEGDWEEWPDRYLFDCVVSAERVEPLFRMLTTLLPGRVYPILDILGHDAFREIDPYISYDLVGLDRVTDSVRRYRDFLFEDGLCGFGAMSEEPFVYIFVDEHKIITVRAEPSMKERVEKILSAFDLEMMDEPAGADASAHEHRSVLWMPDDRPELLGPDEVVEQLRDDWQLLLNVDPDANVDDDGKDLGVTLWRCVARCEFDKRAPRYAEILLRAGSLREAEETTFDAVAELGGDEADIWQDVAIVASDRLKPEQVGSLKSPGKRTKTPGGGYGYILTSRWMED